MHKATEWLLCPVCGNKPASGYGKIRSLKTSSHSVLCADGKMAVNTIIDGSTIGEDGARK